MVAYHRDQLDLGLGYQFLTFEPLERLKNKIQDPANNGNAQSLLYI